MTRPMIAWVMPLVLLAGCAATTAQPHASASAGSASTGSAAAALASPLHLASAPNFRDIGGYQTSTGARVRQGLAYRSDQMDRLSDADLQAIAALQPAVIADLRTASERSREPDRVPAGARHVVLDVAADSTASLGGDMRLAMAQIARGDGAAMLVAANREFVTLPSAQRSYAALVRLMISADGPVVYHCTAGKDRTGWATAVVLGLLGVPRATIMQDYLLSNRMLADKNRATLDLLARSGGALQPAMLEPVLTVRPEYIAAAFDEVDRRYGSLEAYARDGLGLTGAELAALRRKFLTAV